VVWEDGAATPLLPDFFTLPYLQIGISLITVRSSVASSRHDATLIYGVAAAFDDEFRDGGRSPRGELSAEVRETVWALLERADVDAQSRQIIWEDGKRLSVSASVQRIHEGCADFPIDLIATKSSAGSRWSSLPQPTPRNS
jgi:hypothetical protein